MSWKGLGEWWVDELAEDPTYDTVILPLLTDMLDPVPGLTYLDLGVGEGRVKRAVEAMGAIVIGIDVNEDLAGRAGASVVAELPEIPFQDHAVDGVYAVLVLEHVGDHRAVFRSAARVTRPAGVFALVINHPYWSAPGSTPIEDTDGEQLWRPGEYFERGHTDIPIREQTVRFYHRSMGDLLTAAAAGGWMLERLEEHPHHDHTATIDVPRLLVARWRLS